MWLCVLCGNMSTAHMRVFKLLWKYCHSSNLTIIIFLFFFNNSQILLFSAFWRRSRRSTYYTSSEPDVLGPPLLQLVWLFACFFCYDGENGYHNQAESEWWMKKGKKDHSALHLMMNLKRDLDHHTHDFFCVCMRSKLEPFHRKIWNIWI